MSGKNHPTRMHEILRLEPLEKATADFCGCEFDFYITEEGLLVHFGRETPWRPSLWPVIYESI